MRILKLRKKDDGTPRVSLGLSSDWNVVVDKSLAAIETALAEDIREHLTVLANQAFEDAEVELGTLYVPLETPSGYDPATISVFINLCADGCNQPEFSISPQELVAGLPPDPEAQFDPAWPVRLLAAAYGFERCAAALRAYVKAHHPSDAISMPGIVRYGAPVDAEPEIQS